MAANRKLPSQLPLLYSPVGLPGTRKRASAATSVDDRVVGSSGSPQLHDSEQPAELKMNHGDEAAYVATLIMLYVELPDTPLRPGPQDQSTARRLYCQGAPASLVESALLLASLRRYGQG